MVQQTTINPTQPAEGGPLASAPVRTNFQAAANDINNIYSIIDGITSGSVFSVQSDDGSLTIDPQFGHVDAILNVGHANTWTGQQTFNTSAPIIGTGTASTALTLDSSNQIASSITTSTELGYVHGVTSSIQTQLDSKQPTGNYITALTGDVTASGPGSVAATVAKIQGTTVSGTTGTTNVVFSNSPTLVTPNIGTPSAGTLTNCSGLPINGIVDARTDSTSYLFLGNSAGPSNTGIENTGIGVLALFSNTAAVDNTAIGYGAIANKTTGDSNTGVGYNSLSGLTTAGAKNTAVGAQSGEGAGASAADNVSVGYASGGNNATGASVQNVFIGSRADSSAGGVATNRIAIGYNAAVSADNSAQIGNSSMVTFKFGNSLVLDNTNGSTIGSPTGGAKGAGTLNTAGSIYVNNAVVLVSGGALGTPSSGTLTNCAGLPAASVVAGALANGMTATTQSASDNSTKLATTAYVDNAVSGGPTVHKVSCGFSTVSAATGQQGSYYVSPIAGTISAWNIVVDAGTCTVKVWKIATGTTAPTTSNRINTSGVAISTGTAIHSTTTSDFTTTTVTADDIFGFEITAVSGATKVMFSIEITAT